MFGIAFVGYGQKYKTLNYVKVPIGKELTKVVTVKSCPEDVTEGDSIKSVTTYKSTAGGTEKAYTISSHKIAGKNEKIEVDKKISVKLKSFEGKANIYLDENDKSKIHINYWLNHKNSIPKGTRIIIRNRELQCDKTYKDKKVKIDTTKIDSTYTLWKVKVSDITTKNDNGQNEIIFPEYMNTSDLIIEVYKSDSKILDYYLVNKYDKNADYILKLDNREKISFAEKAWEFGAITIPIKLRPLEEENGARAEQKFEGDLNIGAFFSYKFLGRYRARYVRGAGFEKLASISCNLGGFLTLGTQTLDKNNTATGDNPITDDSTQSVGMVSSGLGLMLNVYNFQIGLYTGWDLGVGSNSANWDYHGKQWFGLGFSYSLKTPWKE